MFALLGALDRVLGNKFGVGEEFEQGFMLLGTMALSMIGMIVISPLIADLRMPVADFFHETLHIDPSIMPASLFANDIFHIYMSVHALLPGPVPLRIILHPCPVKIPLQAFQEKETV